MTTIFNEVPVYLSLYLYFPNDSLNCYETKYSLSASSSSKASTVLFVSFLHATSPRHMQNIMHGNLTAVQRHCEVRYGLSDEQPQRIISKIYDGAMDTFGGNDTGTIQREASSRFQPCSVGLSASGSASAADFH